MSKKRDDEMTTGEAAEALGMHRNTIRDWCKQAIDGGRAPVEHVRQQHRHNGARRYFLNREEILAMARLDPENLF